VSSSAPLAAPFSSLLLGASSDGSFWEEWYEHAADSARLQALALARTQGVVPAAALESRDRTGSKPTLLLDLLHGRSVNLSPVQPGLLSPIDCDLDFAQQRAVARALATPDLALVRGYPGTGKSRVIAELLRQAARAGLRTLFLSARAAPLDRVLEHVGADPAARAVRCLSSHEALEALPGCVARLTLPGRLRQFEEQTVPAARSAVEDARATWEARCRDEQTWSRLESLLERLAGLKTQIDDLQRQRPELRATVEAELDRPGPGSALHDAWAEQQRRTAQVVAQVDTCLAGVKSQIDSLVGEEKGCQHDIEQLAPLAEARQGGRWWTGSWWKARLKGDVGPQLEQVRGQAQQIDERLGSLRREADELAERRRQAEHDSAEQRRRLVEGEAGRREADLDARLAGLTGQLDEASAAWQGCCAALSAGTPRPRDTCRTAIAEARAAWRAQLDSDEQEVQRRQEWLEALVQTLSGLAGYLARSARIVAATTAAAAEVPGGAEGFDLLVVDDAQQMTEADLLAAARRARRWVLLGEPPVDLPAVPSSRPAPARAKPALPRPVFERLWNALHADPRRLPVRWRLAGEQLVCSLRPLAGEQERWLQREPVFDRPEIELGIVSPPHQDPQVVEVRFPAATPLEDARAYIFRELEELAVEPAGVSADWLEDEQTVTLLFDAASERRRVCLGTGVVEQMACVPHPAGEVGWKTAALEFERAGGWDLERARLWVEERLGVRDLGRTTVLTRPYRARGLLARFLSGLLYAGACDDGVEARELALAGRPVEFVAVPAATEPAHRGEARRGEAEGRRGGGGTATLTSRPRSLRGGAGLEVDLADVAAPEQRGGAVRRTDLLPGDLRPLLPARGLVNYLEAQAIVSALEGLVSDPAFQEASATWQQCQAAVCHAAAGSCEPAATAPSIAVLCLFPAQAELLGLLVRRSARLSASSVPIEVGLPGRLAQRDCLVALVGLTRSHTHRAVPFSDTPETLVLALTRAVSRLVLFGDPGTLVRRSQWHGALDHLDETSGSLEQGLIARLLGELPEVEQVREKVRVAAAEEHAGRPRESSSV
jgi:hypothetical protein